MPSRPQRIPILALLALTGGTTLAAQGPDFEWRGRLAPGQTLEVFGINGAIDAAGGTGEVQVRAVRTARKSDPMSVRIEVVEHAGGVTLCAVYPGRNGRENECLPGGKGRSDTWNNDTEVDWTIRVPEGVRFVGRTVNGDVSALRLTAPAEARTVNGSVTVETSAWAEASTVNGGIEATLGQAGWTGELAFETVNGPIIVTLPEDLDTEVEASTVNGSLDTDFPLTVRGRWGPRRMTGTIGAGGRMLSLSSVNGSTELRRRR